ncbi:PAS domain S-box-containing protein [Methylosinus sp. sav-2]|uniref:sensor histidine kinase n=1 Tax=Methylosinus sp. sav-2 TaxID=2485168 RepID=UPI00047C7125|nr:ATP-binding protein [Methylosinus sp. sav-2]TDX64297.1 PAS domain S-box-containing protein [Methylosinus sp. sav-2]
MSAETVEYDRYRVMVEASPAAILIVGSDGLVRYANRETEHMFGYAREELIGRSVDLLTPAVVQRRHAAYRRFFYADPSRRRMGVGREIKARRRDGGEFPVEIGLAPLATAHELMVTATILDMSRRREVERALTASVAELERANERLGQFAYVASLDLQQPLNEIAAQSTRLDAAMAAGCCDEIAQASAHMRCAAVRGRKLVGDLLIYARTIYGDQQLEALDLREEVQFSLAALAQSIEAGATRLEVDIPAAAFVGDRAQFACLMQNIVANAVKYRKPGRPAEVTIAATLEQGAIRLSIVDKGVGFEQDFAQRIFEPFSRPESDVEYAGTGIELAICKSIADRHGWEIEVESQPGDGTAFRLAIPALFAPSM